MHVQVCVCVCVLPILHILIMTHISKGDYSVMYLFIYRCCVCLLFTSVLALPSLNLLSWSALMMNTQLLLHSDADPVEPKLSPLLKVNVGCLSLFKELQILWTNTLEILFHRMDVINSDMDPPPQKKTLIKGFFVKPYNRWVWSKEHPVDQRNSPYTKNHQNDGLWSYLQPHSCYA